MASSAVIHTQVGPAGPTGATGATGATGPTGPGNIYSEIIFIAGNQNTSNITAALFTGARSFDTTQFPATQGILNRTDKFLATIQNTSGATKTTISLYDVRNSVVITGTSLDNSGSVSQVLPYDVISGPLTLGTVSGNIRTDSSGMYEIQIEMVGGSPVSDVATVSNARLVITYS